MRQVIRGWVVYFHPEVRGVIERQAWVTHYPNGATRRAVMNSEGKVIFTRWHLSKGV